MEPIYRANMHGNVWSFRGSCVSAVVSEAMGNIDFLVGGVIGLTVRDRLNEETDRISLEIGEMWWPAMGPLMP